MIKRLMIMPLIRRNEWIFRSSVSDFKVIMIMAFGPNSQFLLRYFEDEDLAKAFVEEAAEGKHHE